MIRISVTFTADASGNTVSFLGSLPITIDNISLKKVTNEAVDANYIINDFLSGNTDNGHEIPFRVDTQELQLMNDFETFGNPIALITELERGSMLKIFVSTDDKQFYQLEGTVIKGISTIKLATSSNTNSLDESKPPIAQSIQVSYRDSSKQRCRLLQTTIVIMPTPIS